MFFYSYILRQTKIIDIEVHHCLCNIYNQYFYNHRFTYKLQQPQNTNLPLRVIIELNVGINPVIL